LARKLYKTLVRISFASKLAEKFLRKTIEGSK
jgi:hypothetical protein